MCGVWPRADEFGFPDEMSAFGLQFGHGIGCAIHERPIISRVVSLDHPTEIKEGMVFALETYCPAKDGFSAARIEEEVVVTDKGCRVITLFPAADLPIANRYQCGRQRLTNGSVHSPCAIPCGRIHSLNDPLLQGRSDGAPFFG